MLLQFFIDGLPLFKSCKVEFWPTLYKVLMPNNVYEPFIVSCFCGEGKPFSPALYFEKFVAELNHLLTNGIVIDEQKFVVIVPCFVCDRPARAFAKGIIRHQGYFACERCIVEGIHIENRRIYPSIYDELRTNESFRSFKNPHHHITYSSLCDITSYLKMVKDFPLDLLQLAFLGNMKKTINDDC